MRLRRPRVDETDRVPARGVSPRGARAANQVDAQAPGAPLAAWQSFRTNASLPEPLYHQIFAMLRDRILDGRFAPGGVFPSESEIEAALGVSRITARRALDELAARGLIVRGQGRRSTVAPYRPRTRLLAGVEGMIENNRQMGDLTTVELLERADVPAGPEISQQLRVKRGEPVQRSVRVRSIDGLPFSYAITHLPRRVAKLIQSERMSTEPLIELLERAGIVIGRAEQTISARVATSEVARALHIEAGSALLESERIVFDEADRPVEAIVVLYRPDVYRYAVDLRRTHSEGGRVWSSGTARPAVAGRASSKLRPTNPDAATPRAGRSRTPPQRDR
jgi:GntR family transcriptional regulator